MKDLNAAQIMTRSAAIWTQTIADAKDKRDAALAMAEHDYRSDPKVEEAKAGLEHYLKSHHDRAMELAIQTGNAPYIDEWGTKRMKPRKVRATANGILFKWRLINGRPHSILVPWSSILSEN